MRKITLILCAVLMTALSATASNYFSLCSDVANAVNDSVRISPAHVNNFSPIYVTANLDGYIDHWELEVTHPDSLGITQIAPGSDKFIPYVTRFGNDSIYTATLIIHYTEMNIGNHRLKSLFSSTINILGYWDPDNDGYYDSYGTVKWASGFHDDMIEFYMFIPSGCTEETVTLDCTLGSSTDWRGVPIVSGNFVKTIKLIVAYKRGDVNGNEQITIDDVTTLTNYLLGLESLDQYQLAAADVDGDGVVTVDDLTALVDMMLFS